jgi:hypothetical protein
VDPSGFTAEWLARACGVDLSTARRWKRARQVPARYAHLVRLADGCDLGVLSDAWRGWRLLAGDLVNPEGERFHVDQVRALRLKEQLVAELECRLRRVLESAGQRQARELVIRVQLDQDGRLALNPRAELAELLEADA